MASITSLYAQVIDLGRRHLGDAYVDGVRQTLSQIHTALCRQAFLEGWERESLDARILLRVEAVWNERDGRITMEPPVT